MCLILYVASSCSTSEFLFSTPRSVTMVFGHPKWGIMVFCRSRITDELVLSRQGRANTNPVAASTAVHMATCPSLDLGILKRSMCMRSPNSFAVGDMDSKGSLVYLCGGFVLAHTSHDLQKFSVSLAIPGQYQCSCNLRSVYGAEVCPHSSCTRYRSSGRSELGTIITLFLLPLDV